MVTVYSFLFTFLFIYLFCTGHIVNGRSHQKQEYLKFIKTYIDLIYL
jgi:hypothetical protein